MVSENDPRPPYLQVADHLRAAIAAGTLKAGQRLAAQKQLAKDYGIAPMTVNNAIRVLRDEGLLVSSHGRGVFVQGDGEQAQRGGTDRAGELAGNLGRQVEELRNEVEGMRRQYGRLEALILDLYSRTGQPYPHEVDSENRPLKRAAGT